MNLVAKEYVASQDPEDPGVLVLSRFAGAAESLTEAIIVNPYNIPETADAIKLALEMPLDERKRRHAPLLATISEENSARWSANFMAHLNAAYRERLDIDGLEITEKALGDSAASTKRMKRQART